MTRALNRSISFWILLAASAGLAITGVLVVLEHLGTMTATLKDGSATGLEVYAGQSWIVIGSALLGAGALGILLALALAVASTLLGAATAEPVRAEPLIVDGAVETVDPEDAPDDTTVIDEITPTGSGEIAGQTAADPGDEPQNGSSGSTATATKISVR